MAFDCRSVKSAPDDDCATHGRRKAWIVPAQLPCARWGRAGRCDRGFPARETGSWRRQAQARQTVETRSVHRGRHADTPSLLTACGTPDASGAFVATTLVCLLPLHTGLRTHRASGVPRALSSRGRDVPRKARAQLRRETAKPRPNHCRCLTFEYERNRNRSLRSLCTSSPHHERRPREGGDP